MTETRPVDPPVTDPLFQPELAETPLATNETREDLLVRCMTGVVWDCSYPEAERRAAEYTDGELQTIIRQSWLDSPWARGGGS